MRSPCSSAGDVRPQSLTVPRSAMQYSIIRMQHVEARCGASALPSEGVEQEGYMDPVNLAVAALAALAPYAKKGAEALAAEVGKRAVGVAESLIKALRQRWAAKPDDAAALEHFLEKPEEPGQEQRFSMSLAMQLGTDPELRDLVHRILQSERPELEVTQDVKGGKEATAVHIVGDMRSGRAAAEQKAENVEKVIGAKIDGGFG